MLAISQYETPLTRELFELNTVVNLDNAGYNISLFLLNVNQFIPSPFPNDTTYPFRFTLLATMDMIASGLRVSTVK